MWLELLNKDEYPIKKEYTPVKEAFNKPTKQTTNINTISKKEYTPVKEAFNKPNAPIKDINKSEPSMLPNNITWKNNWENNLGEKSNVKNMYKNILSKISVVTSSDKNKKAMNNNIVKAGWVKWYMDKYTKIIDNLTKRWELTEAQWNEVNR